MCHGRFPQLRWLELHVAERHDQFFKTLVKSGRKMFACLVESCGRTFKNGKARRLHLVDFHHFPKSFVFDSVGRRPKPVPVLSARRVVATASPHGGASKSTATAARSIDTMIPAEEVVVSPAPPNRRARRALERERTAVATRLAQGGGVDDEMTELQEGLMAAVVSDSGSMAVVGVTVSAATSSASAIFAPASAFTDMSMKPFEPRSPIDSLHALPRMVSPSTQAHMEASDENQAARLDLDDPKGRRRRPQAIKGDPDDPERARLLHALSGGAVPIANPRVCAIDMDDIDSASCTLTTVKPAVAVGSGLGPLPQRPAFVPRSVQRKAAAAASTALAGQSGP